MGSCSERIDVNECEETDYPVHQLVWYLRGLDREYEMVERLLLKREETIRAEMEKEVAKWKLVGKTEEEREKDVDKAKREERVKNRELRKEFELKNSEAEESLKKMEKKCADLIQQVMHLRDEEKKLKHQMMVIEENAKERVKKLERECKDLANDYMNLRDGKKRDAEMFEKLKERMKEIEDDAKERVKKLEKECADLRNQNMNLRDGKKLDSEMFEKLKQQMMVFAGPFAGVNPVSLVSTANVKQSDPLVTISDCAKHGLGNYNYIEISSDEDDPSEQQSRSKDKADFSPDQLKVESKLPSESDHETPEASVGLKRKYTSCINEDVTEALSSPPIGKDSSPHLLTREGKKVRPSNEHLTPPSVAGIPDSVNSSQPKEVTRSQGICDDDDPWKKSLLEKVGKVLDEDSSGSSSENSDD